MTLLDRFRRSPVLALVTLITLLAPMLPVTALADSAPAPTANATPAASDTEQGQSSLALAEAGAQAAAGGLVKTSVDPSTGVFHASIPFGLPTARGAVQPALSLDYASTSGSGFGGRGWTLSMPAIERQNVSGGPQYNDPTGFNPIDPTQQDWFVYGGRPIVPVCYVNSSGLCVNSFGRVELQPGEKLPSFATVGWHYYRFEIEDGSLTRFFWSPDHATWVTQHKDGVTTELGAPLGNASDLSGTDRDPLNGIFRWNRVKQYDAQRTPSGRPTNLIQYVWTQQASTQGGAKRGQLSDIFDTAPPVDAAPTLGSFAHHTHLTYSDLGASLAPAGSAVVWRAAPTQFLTRVDVSSQQYGAGQKTTGSREQVRRYWIDYAPLAWSAVAKVTVEGRCDTANNVEDKAYLLPTTKTCPTRPATSFGYSLEQLGMSPSIVDMGVQTGSGDGLPMLFDVNNDGLPDVIEPQQNASAASQTMHVNSFDGTTSTFTTSSIAFPSANTVGLKVDSMTPSASVFAAGSFMMGGRLHAMLMNPNAYPTPYNPGSPFDAQSRVKEEQPIPYALFQPVLSGGTWTWTGGPTGTFGLHRTFGIDMDWFVIRPGFEEIVGDESPFADVDVNGDGLTDLVTAIVWNRETTQPGSTIYKVNQTRRLAVHFSKRAFDGTYWPFYGSASPGPARATRTVADITEEPGLDHYFVQPAPWDACMGGLDGQEQLSTDGGTNYTFADLNGDGVSDWVRFSTTAITTWPGHGDGTFGVCPDKSVACACPAAAPVHVPLPIPAATWTFTAQYSHFHDVDGDGFDDLIVPISDGFTVYRNTHLDAFDTNGTSVHLHSQLGWTTNPNLDQIEFADMNASGVDDIVVRETGGKMAYVDMLAGARPALLTDVVYAASSSNAHGVVSTHVDYESTIRIAHDEATKGWGWNTVTPQILHVVTGVTRTEATGESRHTTYRYWDPVFDGRDRQFLGFTRVRATVHDGDSGDANTETTFFHASCSGATCPTGVDYANRAYRQLPVLSEVFIGPGSPLPAPGSGGGSSSGGSSGSGSSGGSSGGGSSSGGSGSSSGGCGPLACGARVFDASSSVYRSTVHTTYGAQVLYAAMDGRKVRELYASQTDTFLYDTGSYQSSTATRATNDVASPEMTITGVIPVRAAGFSHLVRKQSLDAAGNVTTAEDDGSVEGATDSAITTTTTWTIVPGVDPSLAWLWRPQKVEVTGAGVDRTTTLTYDAHGNVTDTTAPLSGTYPLQRSNGWGSTAPLPATASQDGTTHPLHLTYDPAGTGNPVTVESYPAATRGLTQSRCVGFSYDAVFSQVVRAETLYDGGCGASGQIVTHHVFDTVIERETMTTAPDGATTQVDYDTFGRVHAIHKPSVTIANTPDTAADVVFDIRDTAYGQWVHVSIVGDSSLRDQYVYINGFGEEVATISTGDQPKTWIATGQVTRNGKGQVLHTYVPRTYYGTPPDYTTNQLPTAATPASRQAKYDPFGQVTDVLDIDGTTVEQVKRHGLSTDIYDAEGVKTSGAHAGAHVTRVLDGHGRLATVNTDVREAVHRTLTHYFVWGADPGVLPISYEMMSHEGNERIHMAIRRLLLAAPESLSRVPLGKQRLMLLQAPERRAANGMRYDELFGHRDQPLPFEPLPAYMYADGKH